ncbi:Adenine deaminase [Methanobacterium lacus]|uniref:Adenine deaminase n=1 Tax=Methanobacterium lacus (strain AL-21) TaxID=877455 RepID=F0T657_METLA|nr:adenine deaminase [Methanobacterium lacus]ADZ10564.1 Adenine deaminase [Methanobacterium lacus]
MEFIRGNLLNVFTEEIYSAEVGFENGLISCVKPVDGNFKTLILPGFIDSHIHIESSMICPSRFAEAVVPHGTTSVIADPHEIANVMGLNGINYMLNDASSVPLKMFLTVPSCVPATKFETAGGIITSEDIDTLLKRPEFVGLGEVMNFPGVIGQDPEVIEKLEVAHVNNKPIDGHAPMLSGAELCNYAAAGISTDHESTTPSEALEKRRLGMKIMMREGSSAKNLKALAVVGGDFIVSDDKDPEDLVEGHVDNMLLKAIEYGIDPVKAIKMVTLNPAEHYQLNTGSLVPGKAADMVIVDDIEKLNVKNVYIDGKLVSKNGSLNFKVNPLKLQGTFKSSPKKPSDFNLTSDSPKTVRVIEIIEDQLITNKQTADLDIQDGNLMADLENDVLKIAVVERYGNNKMTNGFIKGFNLKNGAIASSVAHDSHNIIVIGTNSKDMAKAVNTVITNNGGLSVVSNGGITDLKLPIAGLMSDRTAEDVAKDLTILKQLVNDMGSTLSSPFMTLSFLALLVIPNLKISDMGLFDVEKFEFVNIVLDD